MDKLTVVSPLPGTFYRRSSPEHPPFKEDGDKVDAAEVIGLVEVMKNFQEIPAGVSGNNIRFMIEDGSAIMAGDVIAELDA